VVDLLLLSFVKRSEEEDGSFKEPDREYLHTSVPPPSPMSLFRSFKEPFSPL